VREAVRAAYADTGTDTAPPAATGRAATPRQVRFARDLIQRVREWPTGGKYPTPPTLAQLSGMSATEISALIDDLRRFLG
jgi:hypothetical protein